MGARRIRREQRRVDQNLSRKTNGMRKMHERERRAARMKEIIKASTFPYTPAVMSWISVQLDKPSAGVARDVAHQVADSFLQAAHQAVDPLIAVLHAHEAQTANQVADQKTGGAAQAAKTDAQHDAVAQSAATAADRDNKIKAALAALGVGQCDVHSYANVTSQGKDALIAKLHAEGMTVTGDNPWDINTAKHGVKLRAVWDPGAQVLKLIVTSSDPLVPCFLIWNEIDPKVKEIVGP